MREARGIDLKKAQHKEGRQSKSFQALEKTSQKILYAAAAAEPGKPDTQLVQVT